MIKLFNFTSFLIISDETEQCTLVMFVKIRCWEAFGNPENAASAD